MVSFVTGVQSFALPISVFCFNPLPIPGCDPLTVSLAHGTATTKYSDPFSIISFTQDGFPSGRLDSVTVDSDGVVRASFTNGETQALGKVAVASRSEEHTSELQSLMRISYAVFCLKKKNNKKNTQYTALSTNN